MRFVKPIFLCASICLGSQAMALDGLEYKKKGKWIPASSVYSEGNKKLPLCARYKNYFCIKKPGSTTWNGQVDTDRKRHAIFKDPAMGTRAFFRLMRTYRYKYGLTSSNDIFGRYAPATDCIGSVERDQSTGECPNGENPTWVYAARVAKSLGLKPTEDINLFTSKSTLNTKVARALAQAVSSFELGRNFRVSAKMVDRGAQKAGFYYSD